TLHTGETLPYTKLVLATGAQARTLPDTIGGTLGNVHVMRTLADADALTAKMVAGKRLVVIGGGYIGLEAAAEARKKDMDVTVIEAAPRILQRVACAETSDAFRAIHTGKGVDIREATGCARIIGDDNGNAAAVETTDGSQIACDLVIVGIGIIPNVLLAAQAGLRVEGAIVVDAQGRTTDPDIYACGDNTLLPFDNQPTRLESVQNANDQAVVVARNVLGASETYAPMPWFWSDQYDVKLQIAGFNRGYTDVIVRPGKREGSVSHFYFDGDRFIAVDCLNDAATYAMSRKILTEGKTLTQAQVADPAFVLKSVLAA
ncbi:MAG: FAD/NAD(P)-binding oxidoreductase, partial [Ahrensia sp.]